MTTFESASASPETKELSFEERLTALGESVEQGFEDLFAGFEPREPVQAELIELNAAEKAFLSQRMEEKRTVEEETDRMMMANQSADHHEKEAMAIEPVAERLNTTDLSPLSADQNRQIEQVLEIHTPEINPADHVTVETANDLGYEAADLKTLAPIAEKMGRPIFRDGRPDFRILSNPEGQFFIATLFALQKVYNESSEVFPTSGFSDLPVDDLIALYRFYRQELDEMHPHLNEGTNYKARQLKKIALSILLKANELRQSRETDLFEPCVVELMRSPSS